jgi:hypothetical protein
MTVRKLSGRRGHCGYSHLRMAFKATESTAGR